jgi:hypothetical protein
MRGDVSYSSGLRSGVRGVAWRALQVPGGGICMAGGAGPGHGNFATDPGAGEFDRLL